jgi:hypothetical protein
VLYDIHVPNNALDDDDDFDGGPGKKKECVFNKD